MQNISFQQVFKYVGTGLSVHYSFKFMDKTWMTVGRKALKEFSFQTDQGAVANLAAEKSKFSSPDIISPSRTVSKARYIFSDVAL